MPISRAALVAMTAGVLTLGGGVVFLLPDGAAPTGGGVPVPGFATTGPAAADRDAGDRLVLSMATERDRITAAIARPPAPPQRAPAVEPTQPPAPGPAPETAPVPEEPDDVRAALPERMLEGIREACAEGFLDGALCD